MKSDACLRSATSGAVVNAAAASQQGDHGFILDLGPLPGSLHVSRLPPTVQKCALKGNWRL